MRFPRPWRFREGVAFVPLRFASEFRIRQAPCDNLFHDPRESFRIRQFPVVDPKRLFVNSAEKVKWFDADVGSVQSA